MIDTYEQFARVDSIAEVTGPGNRWYRAPPEPAAAAPQSEVLSGTQRVPFDDRRGATRLRLVKLRDALLLPGRVVVNTDGNRLVPDSLPKPVRTPDQLDERLRARLQPAAIERQLAASELRSVAGTTLCATVRRRRRPHLLLEFLGQLWPMTELDGSAMNVAIDAQPGAVELLEPFGFSADRVIEPGRVPLLCEELILATPAVLLPRRISSRFWDVTARLREAYPAPPDAPERIYVSTADAQELVLLEEPELEDRFRAHGFAVVHDDELDGAELVSRFAAAEWVAAPGGATLPAVFAPPGVRRLVLTPDLLLGPVEPLMSREHGPRYLLGSSLGADPRAVAAADWHIDVATVDTALDGLFGVPGPVAPEAVEPAEDAGPRRWRDRMRDRRRRGREARAAPISVTVAAPTTVSPASLFALLDDLAAFTRDEPRLKEADWTPEGGAEPGARAQLETSVGWATALTPLIGRPEATVIVRDVDRPRSARLTVESSVARADVRITMVPAEEGNRVSVDVLAEPAGLAAAPAVNRGVRRAARRYAAPSLNRVLHSFIEQAQRRERARAA